MHKQNKSQKMKSKNCNLNIPFFFFSILFSLLLNTVSGKTLNSIEDEQTTYNRTISDVETIITHMQRGWINGTVTNDTYKYHLIFSIVYKEYISNKDFNEFFPSDDILNISSSQLTITISTTERLYKDNKLSYSDYQGILSTIEKLNRYKKEQLIIKQNERQREIDIQY